MNNMKSSGICTCVGLSWSSQLYSKVFLSFAFFFKLKKEQTIIQYEQTASWKGGPVDYFAEHLFFFTKKKKPSNPSRLLLGGGGHDYFAEYPIFCISNMLLKIFYKLTRHKTKEAEDSRFL